MAVNNLLGTSIVSFSEIIGNGNRYAVPTYQRDYSWNQDQWEDLWNDILAINDKKNVHYMGSVVLQNMKNKKYHVIDGQQRFCTLTLFVLAIINKLKRLIEESIEIENNKERIDLLSKKYIGDKDPGSLTYASKLQLNENNDSFFQTNLLVFRPPTDVHTLQYSDKQIWNAFNYYVKRVNVFFKDEKSGKEITNFLDKLIAEKLMFIKISVEDGLSAYTVFETLNSRGVKLTITDLLKNYLFSISSKVDIRHIKNKWKKIIDIIGLDKFPTFLRHYWISKNKLIRQDYLFRAIKDSIKDSPAVISLLDSLESNALLYQALSNYADNFWSGNKEIKKRIKELTLFKEKQAYPILIASYNNLDKESFSKILKWISIITFRYTIIAKLHTNLKEEIYNKAAIKISNKEATTVFQIAELIKPLYLSDNDFKNSFTSKSISTKRGKKIVRYILFKLENQLSGSDYEYEENSGTIEHILPENGNENYINDFPQSIHESFAYRIGNYSILEEEKNRGCNDLPFSDKKKIYETSRYELSKKIKSNTWTPSSIESRQEKLSKLALTIWKISQYKTVAE